MFVMFRGMALERFWVEWNRRKNSLPDVRTDPPKSNKLVIPTDLCFMVLSC